MAEAVAGAIHHNTTANSSQACLEEAREGDRGFVSVTMFGEPLVTLQQHLFGSFLLTNAASGWVAARKLEICQKKRSPSPRIPPIDWLIPS
ncbi:unnamed protein product [Larinioides sclopetarius]|uniref:Uncharacterized protein n=1 Tax=Larinioides sclopetarius TaxID=280406 RepID=A0AAV1Z841_9ARAC